MESIVTYDSRDGLMTLFALFLGVDVLVDG
jgi:hypothetical protein